MNKQWDQRKREERERGRKQYRERHKFFGKEPKILWLYLKVFESEWHCTKLVRYMGSNMIAIARADRQLRSMWSKLGNWKLQEVFLRKYLYTYVSIIYNHDFKNMIPWFFFRRSESMVNKELRSYLDYMC